MRKKDATRSLSVQRKERKRNIKRQQKYNENSNFFMSPETINGNNKGDIHIYFSDFSLKLSINPVLASQICTFWGSHLTHVFLFCQINNVC